MLAIQLHPDIGLDSVDSESIPGRTSTEVLQLACLSLYEIQNLAVFFCKVAVLILYH